jgi:hypothetical protein
LLQILTASGSCCNTSARGFTTNMGSWENFICEFMLEIEVSYFYMFKKRCLLLQIGSWDSCRHPRKKPGDILSNHYKIPRLHIS